MFSHSIPLCSILQAVPSSSITQTLKLSDSPSNIHSPQLHHTPLSSNTLIFHLISFSPSSQPFQYPYFYPSILYQTYFLFHFYPSIFDQAYSLFHHHPSHTLKQSDSSSIVHSPQLQHSHLPSNLP
eukprot:TRINITY_DN362_c0_g1_i5.p1 TRINITY_DN362_c0_g1~~TRINITY_DN362_c0_g1_i5.p1  ORF type:complete len:126 (+),score=5.07 TRINITY_DN362_c0_g1_i5:294-671(+)